MKDKFFFCSVFLIISALAIIHSWLGWHTFQWNGDTSAMALMDMGGWHPVIISYILKFAYFFTGYTIYTLLLLQTIPFYLGIFIFIWAIYRKWPSVWTFLLILPFFTIQFYIMPLQLYSTSFSAIWIFLLYSLVLYGVLNPDFKHKWMRWSYYTIIGVLFIIALLSRHNAIISVWPVALVSIGLYLNKKDLKFWSYIWRFGLYSFLSGLVCIVLFFGLDKALIRSDTGPVYPANATFLGQITGACIPEKDLSCYNDDWWSEGWQFKIDKIRPLKELYDGKPTDADIFCASWYNDTPFLFHKKLNGLYEKWIYAITKYPGNYFKHLQRYYAAIWFIEWKRREILREQHSHPTEFEKFSYYMHPVSDREKAKRSAIAQQFDIEELKFRFGPKEHDFIEFLSKHLIMIDTIYIIIANFVWFFIAFLLWIFKRKDAFILYLLSVSIAGTLNGLIIPLFAPLTLPRYLYPAYLFATICFCLFVVLLCLQIPILKNFIAKRIKLLLNNRTKKKKAKK